MMGITRAITLVLVMVLGLEEFLSRRIFPHVLSSRAVYGDVEVRRFVLDYEVLIFSSSAGYLCMTDDSLFLLMKRTIGWICGLSRVE